MHILLWVFESLCAFEFLYVFESLSICLSDSHSSYQMEGCCAFDCQGSVHSGRQLPAATFGCLKAKKLSLDRQKALDSP